jgi:hypothetical protein
MNTKYSFPVLNRITRAIFISELVRKMNTTTLYPNNTTRIYKNESIGSSNHNPISYITTMYNSNTIGLIVLSSRLVCIYHVDCWMQKKVKTTSALLHSLNVMRMYKVDRQLFILFRSIFYIYFIYSGHPTRMSMENGLKYIHIMLFGSSVLVGFTLITLFYNEK